MSAETHKLKEGEMTECLGETSILRHITFDSYDVLRKYQWAQTLPSEHCRTQSHEIYGTGIYKGFILCILTNFILSTHLGIGQEGRKLCLKKIKATSSSYKGK